MTDLAGRVMVYVRNVEQALEQLRGQGLGGDVGEVVELAELT
jgi:hypothetical protein